MIVEIVGEVVDASGQAQPVEKPSGVAQLIAELFRLLLGAQVESGQRKIGLTVRGQAVKVTEGVALRGTPAENVGQRTVAERHIPVQPSVEEVHLGIEVAVVVDKEVMVASVVNSRILGRRSVGVQTLVFVAERQVERVGGSPANDRAQHERILCAERFCRRACS